MVSEKIETARIFLQQKFPDLPVPKHCYLILSTARSGSTLLTSHLERIGFGNPIEAFNPNRNSRRRFNWTIDFTDPYAYIKKAIEYQTVNTVTGMKLLPGQFQVFLENARRLLLDAALDLSDHELVEIFFPETRYVHLERKKKLKQAISLSKALQSGIWHELEGEDEEYKKYVLPPLYDREHIECCFDLSLANDFYWRNFLKRFKLEFQHVYYEDLASDYENEMLRIYHFLGIPEDKMVSPPLKRQSNKESQLWEERFIGETPWFRDRSISKSYDEGDLDTLFSERSRLIALDRESQRATRMPATKYKAFRTLAYKIKRKMGDLKR